MTTLSKTRPREMRSSDAVMRAARVGERIPGRRATRKRSRSVTGTMAEATTHASSRIVQWAKGLRKTRMHPPPARSAADTVGRRPEPRRRLPERHRHRGWAETRRTVHTSWPAPQISAPAGDPRKGGKRIRGCCPRSRAPAVPFAAQQCPGVGRALQPVSWRTGSSKSVRALQSPGLSAIRRDPLAPGMWPARGPV